MIEPSIRLRRAILLNDVVLVRRITRNHPELLRNPDFADKSNTSLHLSASYGFNDIAAHLLDSGHERAEISRNTDHETPLMLAARRGHVEVGVLLTRRCPHSIRCVNAARLDALAIAAQNPDSTALIPALLQNPEYPASVDLRDNEGNTALHHASASGSLKALRILLSAGASHTVKNYFDWTPLAYSQTVAAEVYFKSLILELERRKAEGVKQDQERERQRAAGVRLVDEEQIEQDLLRTPVDEDERIHDALQRHWSPVERRRPLTPGSAGVLRDWDARGQMRARSGSGSLD